jgi:DNA-binding CsgD family transcriptional regulator
VLIATLFLSRWAGDAEAWSIRRVAQVELRRPPTAIDLRQSWRSQLWVRLIDRNMWTGIVYLFVPFPLGIASSVALVTLSSVAGAFAVAPLFMTLTDSPIHFGGVIPDIETVRGSLVLVPIGVTAFLIEVHLVSAASALHATWARLMLASRGSAILPLPAVNEPNSPSSSGGPSGFPPVPSSDLSPDVSSNVQSNRSVDPSGSAFAPGAQTAGLASLTPREREVLELIARGHSNAEIAETFVLSEGTIKTYVKRVLSKFEVRDRTQAAVFAYDAGFVRPSDLGRGSEPVPIERYRAG